MKNYDQQLKEIIQNQYEDKLAQIQNILDKMQQGTSRKQSQNFEKQRGRKLSTEEIEEPDFLNFQPSNLKGGMLKEFQLNGINWIISLFNKKRNGILADEMGMGKTIQSIALIAYFKEFKQIEGPHLIVVPLSTIDNWMREFQLWLPCCKAVQLLGMFKERTDALNEFIIPGKFDVIITTYEGYICLISFKQCINLLKKIKFECFIIDEAHKMKEINSQIAQYTRELKAKHKLLLTGTPLQNNLIETWSLLNFLNPQFFPSEELFHNYFLNKDMLYDFLNKQEDIENAKNIVGKTKIKNDPSLYPYLINQEIENQLQQQNSHLTSLIQKVIYPFMLRRTKAEELHGLPEKKEHYLFVGLTKMQIQIYKNLITTNNPFYNQKHHGAKHFDGILAQLRKCCNHPYQFDGVEDEDAPEYGYHIIENAGKMMVLDKLLNKLYQNMEIKNQVLIFSQFTTTLDILEDFCDFRGYKFCRLDGNTEFYERNQQIQDFIDPESDKFIFLISTRAGGLGLNLATANNVIIYDSDFNPQNDLQAIDRAHRIGQVNTVNVYRLITQDTVEEFIIRRQIIKLKFEKLIMMGQEKLLKNRKLQHEEMKNMLIFGAKEIFKNENGTYTDQDIDALINKGEELVALKNQEVSKQFQDSFKNLSDMNLVTININTYENVDYKNRQADIQTILEHEMGERRHTEKPLPSNGLIYLAKNELLQDFGKVYPEHSFFFNRQELFELWTKAIGLTPSSSTNNSYQLFINFSNQIKNYSKFNQQQVK